MSVKTKLTLNIILNVFLLILIITMTYSWMLTQRSSAQLVDYNRNLIITDSDITVVSYAFINNQYVLQETSPIFLELLEPGAAQKYRFDITNNQSIMATTKMLMSNITGDVQALKDFIYVGGTSPSVFYIPMSEVLTYNSVNDIYYVDMIDRIEIPGNSTVSVYVYVEMSEEAGNELQETALYINRFMFIKA